MDQESIKLIENISNSVCLHFFMIYRICFRDSFFNFSCRCLTVWPTLGRCHNIWTMSIGHMYNGSTQSYWSVCVQNEGICVKNRKLRMVKNILWSNIKFDLRQNVPKNAKIPKIRFLPIFGILWKFNINMTMKIFKKSKYFKIQVSMEVPCFFRSLYEKKISFASSGLLILSNPSKSDIFDSETSF